MRDEHREAALPEGSPGTGFCKPSAHINAHYEKTDSHTHNHLVYATWHYRCESQTNQSSCTHESLGGNCIWGSQPAALTPISPNWRGRKIGSTQYSIADDLRKRQMEYCQAPELRSVCLDVACTSWGRCDQNKIEDEGHNIGRNLNKLRHQ